MAEDQVTQTGDQGDKTTQTQPSLGWRSALPDEFKEHEFVKTFQKPGDFVKSALEIKTERDALKTKLDGAIFKPGKEAKPEEISAYRQKMGIPDKPEGYEFPKGEGIEHDPKMVGWFQETAHTAGLSKEQAGIIAEQWDSFITEFNKTIIETEQKEFKEEAEKLKTDLGDKFDGQIELAKRFFKKVMAQDFDKNMKITPTTFLRFVIKAGDIAGEKITPPGTSTGKEQSLIEAMYGTTQK